MKLREARRRKFYSATDLADGGQRQWQAVVDGVGNLVLESGRS